MASEELEIVPGTHSGVSTFPLSRFKHYQNSAPRHKQYKQADCHNRFDHWHSISLNLKEFDGGTGGCLH
jgi:hypothetical protein